MSNMKFAIRKLAITCVLPTALWQGPLMSDALAQNVPTAISKSSAGLPQKLPAKKIPQVKSQPAGTLRAAPAGGAPLPVIQPTGNPPRQAQSQQQQQQQQPAGGDGGATGETGVQRELRLLYEKAGREMPVMDLNEMEVGEPQPGVAPGGSAASAQRPGGQYAQSPVQPAKAPNFFERVFLGRKAASPQPVPQSRSPMPPAGQFRPVPPRGTAPAANYRPFQSQPAPQVTSGQPTESIRPSATGGQPQFVPQPNPQLNFPPPRPIVQQPPAVQINPRQVSEPRSQAPLADELLLADDPEESLEIELNPKGNQPTVEIRPGVIPPPVPAAASEEETELTEPTTSAAPAMDAADAAAPIEENPFSGLQLNTPDVQTAVSATPAAAAAKPSAAANASLTPQSQTVVPPTNTLAAEDDPFLDDAEEVPRNHAPKSVTGNTTSTPAAQPAETDPFLDDLFEVTPKPPAQPVSIAITPKAPPLPAPLAITPKVPVVAAPVSVAPATAARTATAVTTPRTTASSTTPRTAASTASTTTPRKSVSPTPIATHPRTTSPVTSVVVKPPSAKTSASVVEVPPPIAPLAPLSKLPPVATVAPNAPKTIPAIPVGKPAVAVNQSIARQDPPKITQSSPVEDNSRKLAAARESSGLKGFCPVALRQKRQLIESKIQFNSTYHGKKYHFSSAESKVAFEKEPQMYAPAHDGQDGVALAENNKSLPGTLDFAAWFQGRLYLFTNRENMVRFVDDPEVYLDDEHETTVISTSVRPATAATDKPQPQTQTRTSQSPKTLPVSNLTTDKSASSAIPRGPVAIDDVPILSENLDNLAPLAPPSGNSAAPRGAAVQAPAPLRSAGTNKALPAKDAPPPVLKPAVTPRGPKLDSPLLKDSTKTTPASFSVPARPDQTSQATPRLINSRMRLAPPVK